MSPPQHSDVKFTAPPNDSAKPPHLWSALQFLHAASRAGHGGIAASLSGAGLGGIRLPLPPKLPNHEVRSCSAKALALSAKMPAILLIVHNGIAIKREVHPTVINRVINIRHLPIPFNITSHAADVQNRCHYYQDQEYKEPTFLSKHDNEWQRDQHAADFTPMKGMMLAVRHMEERSLRSWTYLRLLPW